MTTTRPPADRRRRGEPAQPAEPALGSDEQAAEAPLSSVANALRVLEFLVDEGETGVTEVSRSLGLSVATAHRMLTSLTAAGYAEQQSRSRRYRPGSKVVALANRVGGRLTLRHVVRQHIVRLAAQAHETVNLGVLRGTDVVYVDRVLSDEPLHIEVTIGSRVPAHVTAMGKALLTCLSPSEVEVFLATAVEASSSPAGRPAIDEAAFRKELDRDRIRGYSEDRGEFIPDVSCVGSAILDAHGSAVAALSISAPTSRYGLRRAES